MTDILTDNTATRMLRTILVAAVQGYEERMLREIERMKEEASELDVEIREGMSNRTGDGFQTHEAPKYLDRVDKLIYDESVASHDAIMSALKSDCGAMRLIVLGTKAMPLEQSELAIVKLPSPARIVAVDSSAT